MMESIRYIGINRSECLKFIGVPDDGVKVGPSDSVPIFVETKHGTVAATEGDSIARGKHGDFSVVKL